MKPTTGTVTSAADHRAEAERRGLEEDVAREALARRAGVAASPASPAGARRRARLRRAPRGDGSRRYAPRRRRAPRGSRRRSRSRRRRRDDQPADDQADEEARRRRPRSRSASRLGRCGRPVLGASSPRLPCRSPLGFNPRLSWRVNDVTVDATRPDSDGSGRCLRPIAAMPVLVPAAVDERLHLVASSRSRAATPACPPRGPCAWRRCRACRRRTGSVGAWSRWSSGPSVSRTSRSGSTFAPTRKKTSS